MRVSVHSEQTAPAPPPPSLTAWFDQLSETQRYVLADEWGFSLVGTSLPAGVLPRVLQQALPEDVRQSNTGQALLGLVAPLALMAVGYAWMWFMHSIIPGWQLAACWLAIGTGYMGLFQIAAECARGSFLPKNPITEEVLGSLIMAPSLFSLAAWRVAAFHHVNLVNKMDVDEWAWHPLTLDNIAAAGRVQRWWLGLVATTPLKFLGSIGGWFKTMQSWDLHNYYFELRHSVLLSWAAPAAFAGVVLPCLCLAAGGLHAVVHWWLGPWLVFHAWLSTLTLLQHTAPHIAWARGTRYDHARSIVSGTVTVPLPGWLERLLNYPNYHLPQHIVYYSGVPYYHAKAATQAVREKLWPYMQEAPLSIKLLINHVSKWQVYDEAAHTYISWDEAMARIDAAHQHSTGTGTAGEAANGDGEGNGHSNGTSPAAA